ncbi:hypothetical protein CBR_g11133 [Chara braunii]|uniref:Uncharacterized protein n=1 Tax=Chara braunii TaxID=69332 RepID=A0A388KQ59_CHABU|nr:hypothetical protein CBR_g11133 [Chara braunii]|eukprot:GBG72201.1 hypothetical protein CBR_g11133 [Chara braunii]
MHSSPAAIYGTCASAGPAPAAGHSSPSSCALVVSVCRRARSGEQTKSMHGEEGDDGKAGNLQRTARTCDRLLHCGGNGGSAASCTRVRPHVVQSSATTRAVVTAGSGRGVAGGPVPHSATGEWIYAGLDGHPLPTKGGREKSPLVLGNAGGGVSTEATQRLLTWIFGLSSGPASPVRNNCASSHVVAMTVRQTSLHGEGVAGRGGRSCLVDGSADGCRPTPSFSRATGTSSDKVTAVLPPHLATPSPPQCRKVAAPAANTTTTPLKEIGRHVWESCRQQMRGPTAENITNGVSTMRVVSDANANDTRRATGDESSNFHCEDEANDAKELEIRPLGARGRGRGGCGHAGGHATSAIAEESVVGGEGNGNDEDGGSAWESGFSAGSTGGTCKRKNMRQHTFDTIAEVMEKHGALMANTVDGASKRQCDILERDIDTQKWHYEASGEANRMMCSALMEITKAIRDRDADTWIWEGRRKQGAFSSTSRLGVPGIGHGGGSGSMRSQGIVISESAPQTRVASITTIVFIVECADKGPVYAPQARHVEPSNTNTVGGSSREVVPLSHVGSGVARPSTAAGERREERGPGEAGRKDERRDGTPRPDDKDDESLRMRKKKTRHEEELEATSKLWTDGKTFWHFWGSGPGRLIEDAVHDCADYYCAIVNDDAGATALRGLIMPPPIIMPPPDVQRLRIQDPAQRDAALGRARRTENVAMRVIHG